MIDAIAVRTECCGTGVGCRRRARVSTVVPLCLKIAIAEATECRQKVVCSQGRRCRIADVRIEYASSRQKTLVVETELRHRREGLRAGRVGRIDRRLCGGSIRVRVENPR